MALPPRFKQAPVAEEETATPAPGVPRFKAAPLAEEGETLPEQAPIAQRPKEGVEFFEWYLGPDYKMVTKTNSGGRVYKNEKTKEMAYWSEFGETQDKKSVIKIMTGKPEAEVLKRRERELKGSAVVKADPVGTRIRQTASGLPFVGEFMDELTGVLRGAPAQEAYRDQTAAFEADRPLEAGGYKVLGGVAGTPPGLPMTAGRGFLQKTVTGAGTGMVLGGAEGAVSGYGRGETPEERARLAGEGGQIGALVGTVVGGGMETVSAVVGNVGRLVTRTDIDTIAKEFGVSKDAAERIQGAFVRNDFAEAARVLDEAGETAMLADAGMAAKVLLDSAIIQGSDEAASAALKKVDPRLAFQFRKLTAIADKVLGAPRGMGQVLEGVQSKSRQLQEQLYTKARANTIDPAIPAQRQIIDQIASQVDDATIKAVNDSYRVAATDPNSIRQITRRVDPKSGRVTFDPPLTVGDVDKITRIIADNAQKLHKDVNPLAFGVSALKSEQGKDLEGLVSRIRTNTRTQFPDYDTALRTAKDTIQQREAAILGEALLDKNTTREHVAEALARATPEEREAMKAGLRSAIDELKANARASALDPDAEISGLRVLFDKFMMPSSREKVAALLGPADARKLMESLTEARRALETKSAVVRGSQTAIRTSQVEKDKLRTAPGITDLLAQGQFSQATARVVQTLTATRPQDILARNEASWDEVAAMLTSIQGPEARRALDIIERAMTGQKATNAQAKFVADFLRKQTAPTVTGAQTGTQSYIYNPETGEVE